MIRSHSARIPLLVRTRELHGIVAFIDMLRSPTVARDQQIDIPSQLGLGARLLQAQAHKCVLALSFNDQQLRACL
jgi:hypothetical protein